MRQTRKLVSTSFLGTVILTDFWTLCVRACVQTSWFVRSWSSSGLPSKPTSTSCRVGMCWYASALGRRFFRPRCNCGCRSISFNEGKWTLSSSLHQAQTADPETDPQWSMEAADLVELWAQLSFVRSAPSLLPLWRHVALDLVQFIYGRRECLRAINIGYKHLSIVTKFCHESLKCGDWSARIVRAQAGWSTSAYWQKC